MSQKEFAEILGVPQNTLSQWESGKRTPDLSVLIEIAKFFKVSVDYLAGRQYEPSEMCNMRVPFLTKDGDNSEDCVYYTSHITDRGRYRAVTVCDSAMSPSAEEGDTVIFRKQLSVEDNDAAIITVNDGVPLLRRVKWSIEGMTVFSDNPDFQPAFYTNKDIADMSIVIHGKAVELRRKLKKYENENNVFFPEK